MKKHLLKLLILLLSAQVLSGQNRNDSIFLQSQEFHSAYGTTATHYYSGLDTTINGINYFERIHLHSSGSKSSFFFAYRDSIIYQWDDLNEVAIQAYPLYPLDTSGFYHLIGGQGKITYKIKSLGDSVKINGVTQNNLIRLSSIGITDYKTEFYVKPGYGVVVISYDNLYAYWDKNIFKNE